MSKKRAKAKTGRGVANLATESLGAGQACRV
jgi:hypothetical protein